MKRPEFGSAFACGINAYIDAKISSGFQERSYTTWLRVFDRFCIESGLVAPVFSRELADEWRKRRKCETTTTHYSRVNAVKHFLSYMQNQGCDVFVARDVSFKNTLFHPHIYSGDETKRYFQAVDAFSSKRNKKNALQYPVLFRLLCCCGIRIDEALGIRKEDIDLGSGIIKLKVTKNNSERFVVLGDDLLSLLRCFANKCFYLLGDKDYVFTSANGGRCCYDTVYEHHRLFLKAAGIPYVGNGEGPRIHDWRHTFAVKSFRQMVDAGMDMYVALPVLSTYLGHKTIAATESYVRLTMAVYPDIEKKFKNTLDEVFGCGGGTE